MTSSLGCLSPSGLARNLSEHPVNVNRRSLAFVVVGPLLRLLGCYGGTDLTLRRTSTEGNLLSRSLPSVLGSLPFVWLSLLFLFCAFPALVRAQQPDEQSRANIAGTVVDPKGTPVVGAQVKLTRQDQSRDPSSGQETLTGDDGQFSIPAIAPGPFQLTVTAAGFATETTSGAVRPGESFVVPQITLRLATEVTEVQVVLSPIEIAEEADFESLIGSSSLPVLVDFWADWCGPCKMLAPEVNRLAANNSEKFIIAKVNTEGLPTLAQRFQINALPTLVLFAGHKEVARTQGAQHAMQIQRFVEQTIRPA